MIPTMEVKDAISDTIKCFPNVLSCFDNVKTELDALEGLLSQSLWAGDAKDKCVQVHGLLRDYCSHVRGLVNQLKSEVVTLERNMVDYPANSECLKIISSI